MNIYQIIGICCISPVAAVLFVMTLIIFFDFITEHPKETKTWAVIAMFVSMVVGVVCLAIGEIIK